jgi:dethiobiotin synthetase
MIKNQYFVTGTDTDSGKTFVCQALLMAAREKGLKTVAYKPVSAGCDATENGLRNEDALLLQQQCTESLNYDEVNPIAFIDPVAPHLAANRVRKSIALDDLRAGLEALQAKPVDLLLVEGAGGWRLPLNNNQFLSDLPVCAGLPIVLVVGLKLGCINHALLTVQAIKADGLKISGWVANQIDPNMLYLEENIATLKTLIEAPLLGQIPRLKKPEEALIFLQTESLF